MKTLTVNDVKIKLIVEMDDMIAVRGNAIASGDDAYDKEIEDGIIDRLNSGDVWAWAQVAAKLRLYWFLVRKQLYTNG